MTRVYILGVLKSYDAFVWETQKFKWLFYCYDFVLGSYVKEQHELSAKHLLSCSIENHMGELFLLSRVCFRGQTVHVCSSLSWSRVLVLWRLRPVQMQRKRESVSTGPSWRDERSRWVCLSPSDVPISHLNWPNVSWNCSRCSAVCVWHYGKCVCVWA